MPDLPASPREAVERLLPFGPALLHLDPRRPGVDVPPALRAVPILRLKVSYRFANPLSLDDDAARQCLQFSDGPWSCVVPWDAVFAVGPDGRPPTWLWPHHLPDTPIPPEPVPAPDPVPSRPRRGHLRLVKG